MAIGAGAPIWSHGYATRHCSELIKSEFGVGHYFEVGVKAFPPMNPTSLESIDEVMPCIKQYCDVDH